jgi:hypothetical protein
MPVLFDRDDDYVCSVLELAKARGEISLADLESIVETGIEAKDSISTDDIADTIDALAEMGVEIDDGLTEEQKDAEFLRSMRERAKNSPITPNLSFNAMASLARAIKREEDAESAPRDPRKDAEEAPAVREVLSKRTWVQNVFARLGPSCRRTRPRACA